MRHGLISSGTGGSGLSAASPAHLPVTCLLIVGYDSWEGCDNHGDGWVDGKAGGEDVKGTGDEEKKRTGKEIHAMIHLTVSCQMDFHVVM